MYLLARTKPTRTISSPTRLELADVLYPRSQAHIYAHSCAWCYYRAGAIKEGSVEISGWRTLVSIELVVVRTSANHGGTNHENRGCLVQFKRENDIKSKRKREREREWGTKRALRASWICIGETGRDEDEIRADLFFLPFVSFHPYFISALTATATGRRWWFALRSSLSLSPSHPFPRRVDTKSLDFDICRSLVIVLVKNLFFFIPCNSQFSIFTLPCNHSMTVDVICFEQIKDCFICQLS